MPGGGPDHKANQGLMMLGPVNVMNQTRGLMPAQRAIFAAVADCARVDFDTAQKIEALLPEPAARPDRAQHDDGVLRADERDKQGCQPPRGHRAAQGEDAGHPRRGQMGAGTPCAAARKGVAVFLKDMDLAAAERGKDYARQACAKNKRMSDAEREAPLGPGSSTADYVRISPPATR